MQCPKTHDLQKDVDRNDTDTRDPIRHTNLNAYTLVIICAQYILATTPSTRTWYETHYTRISRSEVRLPSIRRFGPYKKFNNCRPLTDELNSTYQSIRQLRLVDHLFYLPPAMLIASCLTSVVREAKNCGLESLSLENMVHVWPFPTFLLLVLETTTPLLQKFACGGLDVCYSTPPECRFSKLGR